MADIIRKEKSVKDRNKAREIANKYSFFILIVIMMIFICTLKPNLLKFNKECRIKLSAIYNEIAPHGQEIWLTHVLVNHEEVPISSFTIEKNQNWKYTEDVDDFVFYPQDTDSNNILILKTEMADDIELIFAQNSWSGTVKIVTPYKNDTIDLYSDTKDSVTYYIEKSNFTYAYWDNIIQWIGLLVLVSIFISIIEIILKKISIVYKAIFACGVMSFYILNIYDLLNGLMCGLLISCLLYVICINKNMDNISFEKKKFSFIRMVLHIYFVFALIANRIFMTDALMKFGLSEMTSFIIIAIALLPFQKILVYIFDKYYTYIANSMQKIMNNQIKRVRWLCFLITFSILILMTLGFYPAIIPVDGVSHWTQVVAYEGWGIQDNTSAALTILIRLCYKLWESPYSFILLLIFLFSFIWARVMAYFFTRGMSSRVVYCAAAIIAILPNNYMTLLTIKTNSLYAILTIWATYLLIKLIDNPEKESMSIRFIIEISVTLSSLYLCRHNSFLAVYGVCIVLVFMFIKYTKQHKKLMLQFLVPILAIIMIVKIVTGPIYTYFGVIRNSVKAMEVTYPVVSPLAVAYNNDVELTEDTLEYMNRIRPLKDWSRHNRYHGDTFVWSEPLPQYDLTTEGNIERFKYYFKMLFYRPDIVIKDRLDGIESLWNIFPSKGQGAYNDRYFLGIHTYMPKELLPSNWNTIDINSKSAYHKETAFTIIPYNLCQLTASNKTLDPLMWRTGFSIVLVLYAIYYACITGKKEKLVAAIPMIGTLITLILAISWQLYQYFWVIHITNVLLILYFISPTDNLKIKSY